MLKQKFIDIQRSFQLKSTNPKLVSKFVRKIPTIIWGLLACTAILIIGLCVGYLNGIKSEASGSPYAILKEEKSHLKDVAAAYDELTSLYLKQSQDVSVVFNNDTLQNHPEKIMDALQNINQHRDVINLQLGRIIELRRAAGLMDFKNFSSNQN